MKAKNLFHWDVSWNLKKSFNWNLMLRYTVKINGSVKIAPQKIATYENCLQWKYPPMKVPPLKIVPLKIAPKKITPRKLTPRNLSSMKVGTIVVRKWKLLPCSPYVVMKNKAWWPFWWSWVSWKYRYLFNLTWTVVFL